jgi:hypothetical protein
MRIPLAALLFCAVARLSVAQLAIVNPRFLEYDNGPILAADSLFHAGDTVYLTFQVSGFKTTGEDDDQFHITWDIKADDPVNRPIAEPVSGKMEAELAPEDKKAKWMPRVRYNVQIPHAGAAGKYLIHIAVADVIGKQEITKDIGVNVGGRTAAAPADSLTIRNFQFLRSEKEDDVLPAEGSYRRGDTVWARFDIAGYKFGAKNHFTVGYGLALVDDTGKVIFEEPKAASESEESFYPRQFVAAMMNLKLDPKIKPGTYTIKLHATDSVGNQEFDAAYPFRVE